jgi:hypothetical protein
MRNVINTTANVTTTAIIIREVRTVLAGVDVLRAFSRHLRLYAMPAAAAWGLAVGEKPTAGKQQPAKPGSQPGGSDSMSRCLHRESLPCRSTARRCTTSQCRRPRASRCLRGS